MTNDEIVKKLKDLGKINIPAPSSKKEQLKELLVVSSRSDFGHNSHTNYHKQLFGEFMMMSYIKKLLFGIGVVAVAVVLSFIYNGGNAKNIPVANAAQEAAKQSVSKIEMLSAEQKENLNRKLELAGMNILDVLNAAKTSDSIKEISLDEAMKICDQGGMTILSADPKEVKGETGNWIAVVARSTTPDTFKQFALDENLTFYSFEMNDQGVNKSILYGLDPDHNPRFTKVIGVEVPKYQGDTSDDAPKE